MSARKKDPGPMPAIVTRCNHCDHFFAPPVPEIGQPTDAAYFHLTMAMCNHLQQRHMKIFTAVLQAQTPVQMRLSHLFYLGQFTTNDPELARYRDVSRHSLLRMLQKGRVSDAKLVAQVKALRPGDTFDQVYRSEVLALFKEMRDVLQEEGLYPEFEADQEKRVILASGVGF